VNDPITHEEAVQILAQSVFEPSPRVAAERARIAKRYLLEKDLLENGMRRGFLECGVAARAWWLAQHFDFKEA